MKHIFANLSVMHVLQLSIKIQLFIRQQKMFLIMENCMEIVYQMPPLGFLWLQFPPEVP